MTNYAPYACEYCGRGPLNPHDGPLCEDCRVSPSCELCEEQARMRVPSSNLHLCNAHAKGYAFALAHLPKNLTPTPIIPIVLE